MKIKRKITRILITLMWVILASGLTVLLVAAIEIKNRKTCREVKVSITGTKDFSFLNEQDILHIISGNGIVHPVGKPIEEFNLQHLETTLEKNVWVKDAQLFFDNNFVLHVSISEREPVARIFDTEGSSFYIDSTGVKIPLGSKRMLVRLPVFTGYPSHELKSNPTEDSILVHHMKEISGYILQDSFWMAQIAQIDITAHKTFDMIPTIGNHVIEFGDGENYISKFHRLMVFYTQILAKYGFDRYSRISVQYNSQIIGTKKGEISKIDSIQALKNIQKMIEETNVLTSDSVPSVETITHIENKPMEDSIAAVVKEKAIKPKNKSMEIMSFPVKRPVAKMIRPANSEYHATKPKVNTTGVKPKAVMPKLN